MSDRIPDSVRNGPDQGGPDQGGPIQFGPDQGGTLSVLRRHWPLTLIIGGLLVWGLFHALGAYLSLAQRPGWSYQSSAASEVVRRQEAAQPSRRDPRKALLVGACSAGFIGFWVLALVVAHHRRQRAAEKAALLAENETKADGGASTAGSVPATVVTSEAVVAPATDGGGRRPTVAGESE